jgi:DNA-nicking Smr family endonuclease
VKWSANVNSAAQAWNRNDARAAKALSLRGQSENDAMRKAHREAARELYEERNKNSSSSSELYVDLHGLHPEEAVEYLEKVLLENQKETRPVYAITGTGHHSKNGKDKVGKAIRNFLNEWRYAYREFSVPGDRNNVGGIWVSMLDLGTRVCREKVPVPLQLHPRQRRRKLISLVRGMRLVRGR